MSSNRLYKTQDFECGALFQTLRNKAKLRQQDLADMVGVGVNTVQYWESGTTYPKVETLKKLLEVYLRFELFSAGQETAEAEALWEKVRQEAPRLNVLFDRQWFAGLLGTLSHSPQGRSSQKGDTPAVPHNLPERLTSFVGRKKELAVLSSWLRPVATRPTVRLVTLSGEGGCGKTSLALELVRELLASYPQGIWLVELAPLSAASEVTQALANTLGLKEQAGISLLTTLIEYLGEKKSLLVLDNCEHLIEECAHVVVRLLRDCPQLVVLATSREGLKVSGETVFRVPSLTLPPANPASLTISNRTNENLTQALLEYEAIQLFVERGRNASSNFGLDAQNREVVVELCRRLDGIPLAIELAAARLRVLSIFELSERLTYRFQLLRSGTDRTVLPRQQTLRATVDWSYELLTEPERILFRRLSVFVGGWMLEAAEEVCALAGLASEDILDLLHELVNKSLVIVEEVPLVANQPPPSKRQLRFKLLETLREYGQEQLQTLRQANTSDSPELTRVYDQHLAFYRKQAEQVAPKLVGKEVQSGLEQLDLDYDNLRGALNWSLRRVVSTEELAAAATFTELKELTEQGLSLGASLFRYWLIRSYFKEGREFLEKLRRQADYLKLEPTSEFAQVVRGIGTMYLLQGDYQQATAIYQEGLAIASEIGDKQGIANILNNLSSIAGSHEDYQLAQTYLEESLAITLEIGNKLGIYGALHNLGNIALKQGDYQLASSYYQQGLAIANELGDKQVIAETLNNLGSMALKQEDFKLADSYYQQSLALRVEIGDKRGISNALNNLGNVALMTENYRLSSSNYRKSLTIRYEIGHKFGIAEDLAGYCTIASKRTEPSTFLASKNLKQACRLAGAVAGLLAGIDTVLNQPMKSIHENTVETLRHKMDEQEFKVEFELGKAMSLGEVVTFTLTEVDKIED